MSGNEIIEIGALKVRDGKVAERFMEFIHPQEEISQMITNLTGITNEMVANARPADAVISDFLEFCEDDVLIGHNVGFDYSFMKSGASNLGLTFEKFGIDTFKIAQRTLKSLPSISRNAWRSFGTNPSNSLHVNAFRGVLRSAPCRCGQMRRSVCGWMGSIRKMYL